MLFCFIYAHIFIIPQKILCTACLTRNSLPEDQERFLVSNHATPDGVNRGHKCPYGRLSGVFMNSGYHLFW